MVNFTKRFLPIHKTVIDRVIIQFDLCDQINWIYFQIRATMFNVMNSSECSTW